MIMAKNQAESTKNFASYTITEGLVVSMSSVTHILGYVTDHENSPFRLRARGMQLLYVTS